MHLVKQKMQICETKNRRKSKGRTLLSLLYFLTVNKTNVLTLEY